MIKVQYVARFVGKNLKTLTFFYIKLPLKDILLNKEQIFGTDLRNTANQKIISMQVHLKRLLSIKIQLKSQLL